MRKERLAAFTDAVLAIIMTLLVLELKKPDVLSFAGFWALRENFFAYTLSFFWLGTMWVNLHNEWENIERISKKTVWATLIMLFFSSIFPYSTSIVAANFSNGVAQGFYGLIVLLVTFSNLLTYQTLLAPNTSSELFLKRMNHRVHWLTYDIILKIIGFVVSVTIYPPAMSLSVVLTLLLFVIPNQFETGK
ncbi:TMEM175 family protein [Enterococcus sp. BWR-S5]|uniref:TMEM175 family protein n=1 Tax=Enterococcus sp. BWR-S5 TaxID=2787714 RepID=UPI0019244D98|nr:TMEM175 family protein [Enterococcus sp. BWR-S5]MBL1225893.1 DUF1211 domain-containing protein [Enterococcus sp. BWR-S5]